MIVVDASVVIKWLNQDEEGSKTALSLYRKHLDGEETIILPWLLFIEVANYLATKTYTSEHYITEGLHFLYESNFNIHQLTENDIIEASTLAKKYKTTAYDMVYAVIAKHTNSILITADEKFAKSVDFIFVKTLKEVSEKEY